jgi:ankyrin repeat protein
MFTVKILLAILLFFLLLTITRWMQFFLLLVPSCLSSIFYLLSSPITYLLLLSLFFYYLSSSFVINTLLALGADLNARDGRGYTPMHYAAWGCANNALRLLAQLGADSLATSKIGRTILMYALNAHTTELVLRVVREQILREEMREDTSHDGQKEEMTRAEDNAKKRLNDFLNHRDKNANTALHAACQFEDVERVRILVDAGADINAKNANEYTPLHYAVNMAASVDMVMTLSRLGANMEGGEDTPKTYTPLMDAAMANNVQLITTLINEGAKVYLLSHSHFSSLFFSHHNIECCKGGQ